MKIDYYKTKNGIYLADSVVGYSGRNILSVKTLRFNGELFLENTFHKSWFYLDSPEINKVETLVAGKRVKIGYTLKDKSLASEKIPETLTLEQVQEGWDDDDDLYTWRNPTFTSLKSLYTENYETLSERWEEKEFELNYLGEIQLEKDYSPDEMKVNVLADSRWQHHGKKEINISSIARWEELEQMLTSDLLIHKRPCSISSQQAYEIVRQYVKENIDPKWAVVTSDYNFCFTVKKKIAIKPWVYQWEEKKLNGKSYTKPRFKSRTISYEEKEIFEMTNDKDKYKGYTPIAGFKGESLNDLIENIRLYLKELMDYINSPLSKCPECNGTGHMFGDKFKLNERS